MKTLEYRNHFFDYYFSVVYTEVIALHRNTGLFWEEKNIQNVGYKLKASRLLTKLLNFLPKLRPGALGAKLVMKKCVIKPKNSIGSTTKIVHRNNKLFNLLPPNPEGQNISKKV